MKILVIFDTPGMNSDQYDQCIVELEKAGLGSPDGRISHVCGITEDGGNVVADVWESADKFAKFGETLIPILVALGVTPAEPKIVPYYNSING